MNAREMSHLYLDDDGEPWYVDDEVEGAAGIATKPVPWQPNRIWSPDTPPATQGREDGGTMPGIPLGSTQRPRAVRTAAAGGRP